MYLDNAEQAKMNGLFMYILGIFSIHFSSFFTHKSMVHFIFRNFFNDKDYAIRSRNKFSLCIILILEALKLR